MRTGWSHLRKGVESSLGGAESVQAEVESYEEGRSHIRKGLSDDRMGQNQRRVDGGRGQEGIVFCNRWINGQIGGVLRGGWSHSLRVLQ